MASMGSIRFRRTKGALQALSGSPRRTPGLPRLGAAASDLAPGILAMDPGHLAPVLGSILPSPDRPRPPHLTLGVSGMDGMPGKAPTPVDS